MADPNPKQDDTPTPAPRNLAAFADALEERAGSMFHAAFPAALTIVRAAAVAWARDQQLIAAVHDVFWRNGIIHTPTHQGPLDRAVAELFAARKHWQDKATTLEADLTAARAQLAALQTDIDERILPSWREEVAQWEAERKGLRLERDQARAQVAPLVNALTAMKRYFVETNTACWCDAPILTTTQDADGHTHAVVDHGGVCMQVQDAMRALTVLPPLTKEERDDDKS